MPRPAGDGPDLHVTDLAELLGEHAADVRPPDLVMQPQMLGAARLTRLSFSRSALRVANRDRWSIVRSQFEIDESGEGEVAYRIEAGGQVFHFVAFLVTLDEGAHTDRVIAERWEIAGALVEGELSPERWRQLREQVPAQERGRLDPGVLVITRGNRSVRFFEYLVDRLAAGAQPEPELVGDAGYIMRSTAFYANGKFGMRSFAGYPAEHPLGAPYRAQFLAAWCFRELSYDVVEQVARLRGGSRATVFSGGWRTFFGLGNATGLGLVPYAFKHPRVINAWVGLRELALARVRTRPTDDAGRATLQTWIDRAGDHFAAGFDDPAAPFKSPAELVDVVADIDRAWTEVAGQERAFDELARWAANTDPETCELVTSLLIELDDTDDADIDRLLRVSEAADIAPSTTIAEARRLLDARFGWIRELGLDRPEAQAFWWVYSDNTEEPRRARRERLDVADHDMEIDVVNHIDELRRELDEWPAESRLGDVVVARPDLLEAVERLFLSDQPYGEPRDNPCAEGYLPLQLQRFQLAMYGMDNFKPKSTDWLRVTLFQGAPRISDLAAGFDDEWVLPPMPGPSSP